MEEKKQGKMVNYLVGSSTLPRVGRDSRAETPQEVGRPAHGYQRKEHWSKCKVPEADRNGMWQEQQEQISMTGKENWEMRSESRSGAWDFWAVAGALGWLPSEILIRRFCAERDKIAERWHTSVDAETLGFQGRRPQRKQASG